MSGYVYAGAADWGGKDPAKCNRGLYRLDIDTGEWTTLDVGLPENVEARCVTLHPEEPEVVWVGTQCGPYRSTDLGETWTRFDHGVSIESTLMIISASATSSDRVYCAARRGQVFGTEDGGASWQAHPLPPGVEGVYALACV